MDLDDIMLTIFLACIFILFISIASCGAGYTMGKVSGFTQGRLVERSVASESDNSGR